MTDGDVARMEQRVQELKEWWNGHTFEARDRTVPKAIDYGSGDLRIMGEAMAELLEMPEGPERSIRGQQAALAFYIQGKVGRVISAIKDGREPNPDHEFDIEVYAVMMARVRETGRWP